MAEFQKVMKHFKRMCEYYQRENECPMGCIMRGMNKSQCMREAFEKPITTEKTIMQWAAEHPEPVYPTWIDWLMSEGVIPTNYMAANSTDSGVRAGTFYVTKKAFAPIPADIAKKLGLQTKEGT